MVLLLHSGRCYEAEICAILFLLRCPFIWYPFWPKSNFSGFGQKPWTITCDAFPMVSDFSVATPPSSAPSEVAELEAKRDAVVIKDEEQVLNYYRIRQQLQRQEKEIQGFTSQPTFCVPFLQPGRLVHVEHEEGRQVFGWGCVVNIQQKTTSSRVGQQLCRTGFWRQTAP